MTIKQAAESWQISVTRVRKLIAQGRVTAQIYATPDGQKIVVIPDGTPKPERKERA